ncbi:MAG: alkaline phosphatase family protein, partial [Rhodovibrionaceae bacterium]
SKLMARVPSLAIWDDNDICDGWGIVPAAQLDAPVGRTFFDVAREHFLLFQLGTTPEKLPDFCLDPGGSSLGWHVALPDLHILAPDLRSERRPNRVMGEAGWRTLETALPRIECGRVFLLSSVPPWGRACPGWRRR